METPHAKQVIDLRTTKCPLNFVKAKLALEKLAVGEILEVWILVEGESAINIPNSMRQEGHEVIMMRDESEGVLDTPGGLRRLWIERRV